MPSIYVEKLIERVKYSEGISPMITSYTEVEEKAFRTEPTEEVDEVTAKMRTINSADPLNARRAIYTSFSGCDAIAFINGKVVGELQSVYNTTISEALVGAIIASGLYYDAPFLSERPVMVCAVWALFGEEVVPALGVSGEDSIILQFANEYGQKAYVEISGLMLIQNDGGVSIDSIIMEKTTILAARSVTPLVSGTHPVYQTFMEERTNGKPELNDGGKS